MPLRELIFALYPEPPEEVRRAAADLKYRDYLTVVLVVDRPDVFPDNWIYVHDAGVKMGRIQNYRNWSPEMVPDATTTSLGLEYFLWESDEEWSWSDDRLIELGIRECAALGLIEPSEVRDATVVRMKKAYPVYDGSYRKAVDLLKAYLSEFNNLQTIGRNGLHRYNNQDHSMMTGVLAARNIMGEANDVWRVNTEKEYHEERRDIAAGDRLVPERIRKAVPTETSAAIEAETEREIEVEIDREIESLLFPKLDRVALGSAIGLTAGLIVFLATAVLLVKGGPDPGENLSLLGQYLPGYAVTWAGALIGLAEAGVAFFVLGFTVAWLRNSVLMTYLEMIRRREERARNEDLLERL
jgi:hypothetical protein